LTRFTPAVYPVSAVIHGRPLGDDDSSHLLVAGRTWSDYQSA